MLQRLEQQQAALAVRCASGSAPVSANVDSMRAQFQAQALRDASSADSPGNAANAAPPRDEASIAGSAVLLHAFPICLQLLLSLKRVFVPREIVLAIHHVSTVTNCRRQHCIAKLLTWQRCIDEDSLLATVSHPSIPECCSMSSRTSCSTAAYQHTMLQHAQILRTFCLVQAPRQSDSITNAPSGLQYVME
jgi:hypothetical protein